MTLVYFLQDKTLNPEKNVFCWNSPLIEFDDPVG